MTTAADIDKATLIKPEILSKIQELYELSFPELIYQAQTVHREHFDPSEVQFCTLSSIKTGSCPENCKYCPQSAHYNTEVESHPLLQKETVLEQARNAKSNGSTRFCMGASWRDLPDQEFEYIEGLIKEVSAMGMEVCCTLGMVNKDQAERLAEAGLHTYNHNVDTSPEHYENIITTRIYEERIATLKNIGNAGINVCSGGILGMGESAEDRMRFLGVLASLDPQPNSVPINTLVPIQGTPLEGSPAVEPLEMIKMVAIARIMLPKARVRLSAGRVNMSEMQQAMCFVAGANSIHTGDKLLTTPNVGSTGDHELLEKLNMKVLS